MMRPDERPYHIPVLLHRVLEGLNIREDGTYVDLTFGGGGHASAILSRLGKKGRLIAMDQDPEASDNCKELKKDPRFCFVASDFRYMEQQLYFLGITEVHGILADLGLSSAHLDRNYRGFSYYSDDPPDMRMNPARTLTAGYIVNTFSPDYLAGIFFRYGEIRQAHKLAKVIEEARKKKPITSCRQLAEIILACRMKEKPERFLARAFQALRMEVNDEIAALREMLRQSERVLVPGGRLVVISYHSLEDREVKKFFRSSGVLEDPVTGKKIKKWKEITPRPLQPDEKEIQSNPRARSAKLRIAEKIHNEQ